jgi:hypothetical protein
MGAELVAAGHELTVITTRKGDYPFIDPQLIREVAPKIRVIRTRTPSFGHGIKLLSGKGGDIPYGSFKAEEGASLTKRLMLWVRRNLVFPDARVVWNPFLYRAALSELRKGKYDALITSGPPQSTHLVGYRLQRERHIPWMADFRDPWTQVVYLVETPPWAPVFAQLRRLERRIVADADAVLTVSQAIADELPPGKKHVIRNGFRANEFAGMEYRPGNRFRIKYIGTLTAGRELGPILLAVNTVSREYPVTMSFIGAMPGIPSEWHTTYPHIAFENQSFMPHREALAEAVDAEALLLVINRYSGSKGYLTMKLFEYAGSRTPVLGVGPTDCEAAQVLAQFNAGTMVDYVDTAGMETFLRGLAGQWKSGSSRRNERDLSALTASGLAAELVRIAQGLKA